MPSFQASCVAIGNRALMIEGPPGSGKSSLTLSLIDRGAILIGDDSLMLTPSGERLIATPHPNTRGLLEVRNLGLIEMPVCEEAVVSLVVRLDEAAPRFVEQAEIYTFEGLVIPMLRLWPESPALAIKAELALQRYGLAPAIVP